MWRGLFALVAGLAIVATAPVNAQKKYDIGASDTEIKIGQTSAHSGVAGPTAPSARQKSHTSA